MRLISLSVTSSSAVCFNRVQLQQHPAAPKCSKLELTPTGGQWIKSPSRLQRLRRPSSPSPALFSFSGKRFSPRHRGDLHFSGMGLSTWGHGHVGAPCAPSGLLGRETEAAQAQQPAQHTASSEFSRVSNDDGRRRAACEPGRRP